MTITLGRAVDIIERAKNCLVTSAIGDPHEVCQNTLGILDEYSSKKNKELYNEEWKYIVVIEHGLEVPVVFPKILTHSHMCRGNAVSAGFCVLDGERTRCYGESATLGLSSREQDTNLLKRYLFTVF